MIRKMIRTLAIVIAAALVLGVFGFTSLMSKVKGPDSAVEIAVTPGVKQDGFTNIAIFGVDSRDNNLKYANSDAILVASLNHRTKELQLVSVYRDTLLDVGDGVYQKCNAAYMIGGPEQAVNMLNQNLDLEIQNYIAVNFQAVSRIVDLVGGIDVDLTAEECGYINFYIEETAQVAGENAQFIEEVDGTHHLDGPQAVSYTRIRYTAGNDYKRTERQRIVLSKVMEKLKSSGPIRWYQVAAEILPMVQTNLSSMDLASLGLNFVQADLSNSTGFPFNPYSMDVAGLGSCVIVEDLSLEVQQLHEHLFGVSNYPLSNTAVQASMGLDEVLGRW